MTKKCEDNKVEKCFVITPIGEEGSPTRTEITGVIESVIEPVLEGQYIVNAAHLSLSSMQITKEIIEDIYEADLIIANLTGANPNVMYELSFAHALRKPVIHIIKEGETPPFDIRQHRYLTYTDNMIGVTKLNQELSDYVKQIRIDSDNDKISNLITDSIDSVTIKSENRETSIVDALAAIMKRLDNMEKTQEKSMMLDKGLSNYETSRDKYGNRVRTRTLVFEVEVEEENVESIREYIFNYSKIHIDKVGITNFNDEPIRRFEVRYSYTGLYDDYEFEQDLFRVFKNYGAKNLNIIS